VIVGFAVSTISDTDGAVYTAPPASVTLRDTSLNKPSAVAAIVTMLPFTIAFSPFCAGEIVAVIGP